MADQKQQQISESLEDKAGAPVTNEKMEAQTTNTTIEAWADSLTVDEAVCILNKYKGAAKSIMLNGKNDDLEVDASHLDSRGPLLEARIARG